MNLLLRIFLSFPKLFPAFISVRYPGYQVSHPLVTEISLLWPMPLIWCNRATCNTSSSFLPPIRMFQNQPLTFCVRASHWRIFDHHILLSIFLALRRITFWYFGKIALFCKLVYLIIERIVNVVPCHSLVMDSVVSGQIRITSCDSQPGRCTFRKMAPPPPPLDLKSVQSAEGM